MSNLTVIAMLWRIQSTLRGQLHGKQRAVKTIRPTNSEKLDRFNRHITIRFLSTDIFLFSQNPIKLCLERQSRKDVRNSILRDFSQFQPVNKPERQTRKRGENLFNWISPRCRAHFIPVLEILKLHSKKTGR